ncbi:MAG: NrsF family protein [Beijerinckiaceae bacterium]|nr:NrsF family protein [Beijerinckiaceae bacterium]
MKTADLIRALTADNDTRTMAPGRALALALIPGVAIALSLNFAVLGLRPQLLALLGEPRLTFKLFLTVMLALLTAPLAVSLVKPGTKLRSRALLLAAAPALLLAAVALELFAVPRDLWGERLKGSNAIICLIAIPLLAAAPLAAALIALRRGAPGNPMAAGAAAGLLAGAIGAACYATHCADDSPLFVAVWYTLAAGIVALAGALAGRKLLRW